VRRLGPALALLLTLTPAQDAGAAGYAINDQGTRALSQGLAATATLEGPETLFYNPAGLAAIDGWQISGGMTQIRLDVTSTSSASGITATSARDHFEIPHLYVARGVRRRDGSPSRWSFGTSVNAPYGLATEWPKDFEGRFVSRIADLKTMQIAGLAAVRLPRGWSIGGGPTWTRGEVQLVRDVDLSIFRRGHSAEADLTGEGSAWGWRAGTRWQGKTGWRFGTTWHGQTTLTFEGDVDYTVVPLGAFSLDEAIATLFVDGPASTALTLPATAWIGAGRSREKLSWEIGLTWTNWSVMDEVIVDLEPIEAGGTQLVINEFLTPRWHDAWAVRAGGRFALTQTWALAAGIARDLSPVPVKTADPLLPDSDRLLLSFGATRTGSRLTLDLGVQAVRFDELDTKDSGNELEASYDSSVLAFGATATWRFGRNPR